MKLFLARVFLAVGICLGGISYTSGCDFCNLYLSIQPNDYQHSLGVQYRFRNYRAWVTQSGVTPSLRTEHGGNHIFIDADEPVLVEEAYRSYEVWGRFFIRPEWQVFASVAYAENLLLNDEKIVDHLNGITDLTLLSFYQVTNTISDSVDHRFRQRLLLGGGLKLPTGTYKIPTDGEIDYQMQPGTGSLDFLLSSNYLAQWRRFGFNGLITYRFNTKNDLGFTFANRFNLNADVFYQLRFSGWTLQPQTGLYFEHAERDVLQGKLVEGTGGRVLFSAMGGIIYRGRFSLGIHYQSPLTEELHDIQLPNRERWIAGLTYYIPGK
ncbi:MAG: hypothetical protein ACFB10_22135 [Salibacteraceae bacterium]